MAKFDGSFEGAVYEYQGISQLKMIAPWFPQWVEHVESDPDWKNKRPEYGIKEARFEPDHVYRGSKSQKVHHNFATYDGGIVQGPIDVPDGAEVTYLQYCKLQSGKPNSQDHGDMQAWIGIDPTGGTDMYASSVVWSNPIDSRGYGTFVPLAVTVKVEGSKVTLFCRALSKWAVDWNDAFWSYGELEIEGGGPPPPEPPPPPLPGAGHTLRVYLDDTLIAEEPFEVQVTGVQFAGITFARPASSFIQRVRAFLHK